MTERSAETPYKPWQPIAMELSRAMAMLAFGDVSKGTCHSKKTMTLGVVGVRSIVLTPFAPCSIGIKMTLGSTTTRNTLGGGGLAITVCLLNVLYFSKDTEGAPGRSVQRVPCHPQRLWPPGARRRQTTSGLTSSTGV